MMGLYYCCGRKRQHHYDCASYIFVFLGYMLNSRQLELQKILPMYRRAPGVMQSEVRKIMSD